MNKDCARAEILAGAIALGEASGTERDDYRRHIAGCASCLRALGGEREIERVMETVKHAAQSEVWEPVPLRAGERRTRTVRRAWTFGLSTAAVAVIASLGIHTLLAANVRPPVTVAATDVAPVAPQTFHVSLERRPPASAPAKPKVAPVQAQPKIVVVHNVITLKQSDRPEVKTPVHTTETTVAADTPSTVAQLPQAKARASNVPVWRRGAAMPHAGSNAVNVARADTPPVLGAANAESIAVAPSYIVREVTPIGGDTAINPRPAPIAYAQGAEGTTAFEVSVDERGTPVKCTITKSSGYLSLDDAVCKAAMKARYSPRTVNGHATVGIYRDAFTFRALQPPNTDQQPFPQ